MNLPTVIRFPEFRTGSRTKFLSVSIMTEEIQGFETMKEMSFPHFWFCYYFFVGSLSYSLWARKRLPLSAILMSHFSASDIMTFCILVPERNSGKLHTHRESHTNLFTILLNTFDWSAENGAEFVRLSLIKTCVPTGFKKMETARTSSQTVVTGSRIVSALLSQSWDTRTPVSGNWCSQCLSAHCRWEGTQERTRCSLSGNLLPRMEEETPVLGLFINLDLMCTLPKLEDHSNQVPNTQAEF